MKRSDHPMNLLKPSLCCFLLLLSLSAVTGAQEQDASRDWPWALGGGVEFNQGSKSGWAQGYSVSLDRRLLDKHLSIGLRGSMDNDNRTVSSLGGALFLRLYPWKLGLGGPFAQFGFGFSSWQEDDRQEAAPTLDCAAGFRYFFLKGFYAEAMARSGFPFQWALALSAGHRFSF
jgi:hypothetical protein